MSIWSQNVCLAATTIEPESLPALVTLFANALGDAAQTAFHGDAFDWTPPTCQTAYQRVQGWVRQTGARAARLTRRMVHDNDVESQPTECGLEPLGAARVN